MDFMSFLKLLAVSIKSHITGKFATLSNLFPYFPKAY